MMSVLCCLLYIVFAFFALLHGFFGVAITALIISALCIRIPGNANKNKHQSGADFIELTVGDKKVIINLKSVTMITQSDGGGSEIWQISEDRSIKVDETLIEIKKKIKEKEL